MVANRLVRSLLALGDSQLRQAYAEDILLRYEPGLLADALDELARLADAFDPRAREALLSVVTAMNQARCEARLQVLREEAAGRGLGGLERLLRARARAQSTEPADVVDDDESRVPDYGAGRVLTLGERKSLARRPDRDMLERLLLDPHPDVIRRLLANPRLTEELVVRLASRRPGLRAVLSEIARAPRWGGRARVRLALILNPSLPEDIAVRLASLLLRQELQLVLSRTPEGSPVHGLCADRLRAAPPRASAVPFPAPRVTAVDPKLLN
ncbi:MAG: hypothetical protein IPQ09_24150 [Myxococcales bacterium]|nr:hypothetical protein [Myxococcales bacterium]